MDSVDHNDKFLVNTIEDNPGLRKSLSSYAVTKHVTSLFDSPSWDKHLFATLLQSSDIGSPSSSDLIRFPDEVMY